MDKNELYKTLLRTFDDPKTSHDVLQDLTKLLGWADVEITIDDKQKWILLNITGREDITGEELQKINAVLTGPVATAESVEKGEQVPLGLKTVRRGDADKKELWKSQLTIRYKKLD